MVIFINVVVGDYVVYFFYWQYLVKVLVIEFVGVEYGDYLMCGGGYYVVDGVVFVKGGDVIGGVDIVGVDKY